MKKSPLFARNLSYQLVLFVALAAFSSNALAADFGQSKVVTIDSISLTIPSNLTIQRVASAPLTQWPIVVDWDEQGRLVIAESGGVAKPIDEHNKQKLHRIVRLVDDNGDGVFDRRIVAAADFAFPEGVLCLGKHILVAAPPEIWQLTDEDGDGVCESREIWFDGKTITGCANDLHGPYLGRDGWIYWCKGAFAEQHHILLGGKTLTSTASHIFRRRLDGGPIESVIAGGTPNPVELASTPEGDAFFSATFLQAPANGQRDGISHVIYGGLYGRDNPVAFKGQVQTGPLMPIMTHLGPAAPSGLIYLESNELVSDFMSSTPQARTIVAAQFNLQRVTAHRLKANGASFTTDDFNLVVADRIDFHPTDVIEDADGSLLVVDTGGWYNLCCPTSKVDQATAGGGIYRISSLSTQTVVDPRGNQWKQSSTAPKDWIKSLADDRPYVRKLAAASLHDQRETTQSLLIECLTNTKNPTGQRLEALWGLCRCGDHRSLAVIASMLSSEHASIRQAAASAVSVERVKEARQSLEYCLQHDPSLAVRRVCAEALGRLGNVDSIAPLMTCLSEQTQDRALEHSLLYAIIEIGNADAVSQYLVSKPAQTQRAALIVLEQLHESRTINSQQLFRWLKSDNIGLRAASLEVLCNHSEFSEASTESLEQLWNNTVAEPNDRDSLAMIVGAWSNQPNVQRLLVHWLTQAPNLPAERQNILLDVLSHLRSSSVQQDWAQPITNWLKTADDEPREKLATWLKSLDSKQLANSPLANALVELAQESVGEPKRALRYIAALPAGTRTKQKSLSQLTVDQFIASNEQSMRRLIDDAMDRLVLERADAQRLLDGLDQADPLRLPAVIGAISRLRDDSVDRQLFDQLDKLPAARTISTDQIKNFYRARSKEIQSELNAVLSKLTMATEDIVAKVDETHARLKPGDPVRGLQIFRSEKAACSACHRVGYVGGSIGPELSRIGASRTRRDLLEAILFPNARLEQNYQSVRVLTEDGLSYNGLVQRESNEELELLVAANKKVIIPIADIEMREASPISVMPAGLEELLSKDDLADLLSMLEAAK